MGRRYLNSSRVLLVFVLATIVLREIFIALPGSLPAISRESDLPQAMLKNETMVRPATVHFQDWRPSWLGTVDSDYRGYGTAIWRKLQHRESSSASEAAQVLLEIATVKDATLSVVQVGACDGDWEATNDPMQHLFKNERVRAISLEPVPSLWRDLQERLATLPSADERLLALNAAICMEPRGEVPFYVVSDDFARDNPGAEHWAQRELGSFQRRHLRRHHIPSKYIQQIPVQCLVPWQLFEYPHSPVGNDPRGVDVLVVDAEGLDAELVQKFLEINYFRPALIIFEWKHLSRSKLTPVLDALRASQYVYWRDNDQVVAVHAGPPPLDEVRGAEE